MIEDGTGRLIYFRLVDVAIVEVLTILAIFK